MSARTRLLAALGTSGLVLGVFAGARLGAPWWAVALAPAPLIAATRCLPLLLGLTLAAVVGAAARALGALGVEESTPMLAALGALALVPALLADRLAVTRWPGPGSLAFPLAVLATDAMLRALDHPVRALPVGSGGALDALASGLGWAAPPLVCAALAQALGGLASVGNWQRTDPLPREEREAGTRHAAVAAVLLVVALLALAATLGRAGR